jgi:hypothetical protein
MKKSYNLTLKEINESAFKGTKAKRQEIKKALIKLKRQFDNWEATKQLNFKTFQGLKDQAEAILYLIKEFVRC